MMDAAPITADPRLVVSGLSLTPVTPEMRSAFQQSRASFATASRLRLPDGWPEFPEGLAPLDGPGEVAPWTGYLFSIGDCLVGNGGFVGPPDTTGTVEIGFEIAPAFRNRGYATAAAAALIELAFEHRACRVMAHTLAERNASNTALRKAGMAFVGTEPEPSLGHIWRFAVNWPGLV